MHFIHDLFDHLFLLTIHIGLKPYMESNISIEISFLTWRLLSTRNPSRIIWFGEVFQIMIFWYP